jgi:signal transduction histidine kinase
MARDAELDDVVTETLETMTRLADVERGYITLIDGDTFHISHEWTAAHIVPHRPAIQRLSNEQFGYSIGIAHRNEILAVPDVAALPDIARSERDSFSSFGVRSVLQIPIRVDDGTLGLMGFNGFRPIEAWSGELVEAARRVAGAIGVALVRQRSIQALHRARDEAEQANRTKDELLASFSHELRTPLHVLLGYAELLELDDRSESDREGLLEIQFNGRRLLTLVDDLLHMAAGVGVSQSAEPTDVQPIVDETVATLSRVAALRDIRLDTDDSITDLMVAVAPGRLRQVMHCVLSGALQSLIAGGTINVRNGSPTVAQQPSGDAMLPTRLIVTMTGDRVETSASITPLARALMDGFGTIDISTEADSHTAHIVVAFGQDAKP